MAALRRALIWDFDGTLGERPGKWSGAVIRALDELLPGHPHNRDAIARQMSGRYPWHHPDVPHPHLSDADTWWRHLTGVLATALRALGLESTIAHHVAERVRHHYTEPAGWRRYPDSLETLAALSGAGWRHVLLSNHVPELPDILATLGLTPMFAAVVNSADTGFEKPHPEAYRLALRAAGDPVEVWMIGDNPTADVAGAERAGIPAILVRGEPVDGLRHARDLHEVRSLILDSTTRVWAWDSPIG